MPITWETTLDAALAKAKEPGRLAMVQFHSPH